MKKKIVLIIIIIAVIITASVFIINKVKENKLKYTIEQITEYNYFVSRKNEKYGVIDNTGKTVIEATYDMVEIPNPTKDVFICYKNEKSVAMNSNNQQLFAEYNSIEAIDLKNNSTKLPYEKSALKCEKNGKYGIIDFSGKPLLDTKYDNIEAFANIEGELQIEQDGKTGIANINGTIVVKPEYDTVNSDNYYDEESKQMKVGYIVGNKNDDGYKYGYINKNGKNILKIEYNDISRVIEIPDKEGCYLITAKNGQYGVNKDNKNIINNEYQAIEYENNNKVFILQKGKSYGLADIFGKTTIPVENTSVQAKGNYIYVEKNNLKQVYDNSGNKVNIDFNKTIMPTNNDNYKITIVSEENGNYYGVVNANNKQVIKPEYLYIEYAFDNYFIVCGQDGKLGVLDSDSNTAIELKYDLVQKIQGKNIIQTLSKDTNVTEIYKKDMSKICEMENASIDNQENYLRVYSNSEINYYDNEGNNIKSSQVFPNNKIFLATKDGKWGYVDSSGNTKVEYEYDFATEVNKYGYAGVKKDGKWGCINSEGKVIVEPKYEISENYSKADFLDEYIKVDNGFGNEYYTNEN